MAILSLKTKWWRQSRYKNNTGKHKTSNENPIPKPKKAIIRRSKMNRKIKISPWSHTWEPFLSLLSWIICPLTQVPPEKNPPEPLFFPSSLIPLASPPSPPSVALFFFPPFSRPPCPILSPQAPSSQGRQSNDHRKIKPKKNAKLTSPGGGLQINISFIF